MRVATFALSIFLLSHSVTAKELVITFGGDVNFNRSGQTPKATGAHKGGFHTWAQLTAGIAPLFDGDINFLNLETVVTDKTNLRPTNKKFVFQTHANALTHMVEDLGINLVSAANNHSYDYRWKGYAETHKFLEASGVHHAGVGFKQDLFKPTVFEHQGVKIAFNALSFLSHPYPASDTRMGQLNLRNKSHWEKVIDGLAAVEADIKILSLHQGIERQVTLEGGVRQRFLEAIEKAGLNLILAHHPHVARGVERVSDTSVIYYGLGNFLMLGARNMGPLPNAQDFGLFGRAYFSKSANNDWQVQALEAVTLTDMHLKPKPLPPKPATVRMKHLNALSKRTSGNKGVSFNIRADGTGVACFVKIPKWPHNKTDKQKTNGKRVSKICQPSAERIIRPSYKPLWIFPARSYDLPVGL